MKVGAPPWRTFSMFPRRRWKRGVTLVSPVMAPTLSLSCCLGSAPPSSQRFPLHFRCTGTHRSRRLRPSLVDGGVVIWIWQLPELSCPPWLSPFELEQGTGRTRFRPALEARDTVAAQAHPLHVSSRVWRTLSCACILYRWLCFCALHCMGLV